MSHCVSGKPVIQNQKENDRQPSYKPIGAPMYSPSICSVPESKTLMRGPWLTRGEPFLYHLILGWGVPIAWQGRVATDCSGKVWLAGPICTMGGGTSSTDVTWTLMIMIMEKRMPQSGLSHKLVYGIKKLCLIMQMSAILQISLVKNGLLISLMTICHRIH